MLTVRIIQWVVCLYVCVWQIQIQNQFVTCRLLQAKNRNRRRVGLLRPNTYTRLQLVFGSTHAHGKGDLPGGGWWLRKFSAGLPVLLIYRFKFISTVCPRSAIAVVDILFCLSFFAWRLSTEIYFSIVSLHREGEVHRSQLSQGRKMICIRLFVIDIILGIDCITCGVMTPRTTVAVS